MIGGGHNALTCAAYLARAGLRVVVLEGNAVVGGAAVTETFAPGFRNSVASYTVSLLNPEVIRDLELGRHGLRIVERPVGQLLADRRSALPADALWPRQPAARRRRSSRARDAERLPAYDAALEQAADVLRDLVLRTPPNVGGGIAELDQAARASRGGCVGLDVDGKRLSLDLFTKSAADFLDQWFESEIVKAAFAFDGIVGAYACRTRRARPTCCCITASARSTASRACGATRSAAWARSSEAIARLGASGRRRDPHAGAGRWPAA